MRRLLSIVLTAIFLLPLVSPLMAAGMPGDAGVPACCRRNGKHHCMMSAAERARMAAMTASHGPQWQGPVEKCPYCPAVPATLHSELLATPVQRALFTGMVSEPAAPVQAACAARIAHDRSRQKRGPPSIA